MFKNLICAVNEAGLTNVFYYGFQILGILLALINALIDAKHLKIKIWKALVAVLTVYPVIYVLRFGVHWVERLFYDCDGANIIKAFIFIPVVIWPVAKLLKVERVKINQLFAVIPCIGQGISHLGCLFPGCCEGHVASWGVYNYYKQCTCIPVQIFETIVALLIGFYLEWRFRKNNWQDDNKALPLMFVLFGVTRFALEFLRTDYKIYRNLSNPALHCLLMAAVGAIWLIVINKREQVTKVRKKRK